VAPLVLSGADLLSIRVSIRVPASFGAGVPPEQPVRDRIAATPTATPGSVERADLYTYVDYPWPGKRNGPFV
jgi:hypothetical protein